MPLALLTPQFKWTFYAHAAICFCGVAPLFSPESIVPYLVRGCSEKEQEAVGAVLAVALQLYAALLVVQAKLLRHAAATPADMKYHSALAQAQGAACALSVGVLVQAEGTGHSTPALMPLTLVCTLIAARYGGGVQRMQWALAAAPKDPKEKDIESEFQRGLLTELFMLFPVPWLTRMFQAYAFLAFLVGGTAFCTPDLWVWILSPTKESVAGKCPLEVLRFVVKMYGALSLGQFWLAWKATRFVNLLTRRRITESWAAVFTVSTVVLFMAMRSGAAGWTCSPLMLVFAAFAIMYWATYMEPDVIPGAAATASANGTAAAPEPAAGGATDAAAEKPKNGKTAPKGKAKKDK